MAKTKDGKTVYSYKISDNKIKIEPASQDSILLVVHGGDREHNPPHTHAIYKQDNYEIRVTLDDFPQIHSAEHFGKPISLNKIPSRLKIQSQFWTLEFLPTLRKWWNERNPDKKGGWIMEEPNDDIQ